MLNLRTSRPHRVIIGGISSWPIAAACFAVMSVSIVQAAEQPAAPTSGPVRLTGPQRAAEAERLGKLALAAYDAGDFVASAELAEQAMRYRADQPEAMITYALLLKDREPRDSLDLISKYNKTDRGMRDFRGYEAAGDLYSKSNNPQMAANSYAQALRWAENVTLKRPVKSEIEMKLAEVLSLRQKCKDALVYAEKAGHGLQQTADLQWRLAKVYTRCGKGPEATAAVEAANKLLRTEIEAMRRDELKQFNELFTRLTMRDEILKGQYKAAQERLDRLAAEKKESPETRVLMARCLIEQGDNDRMTKLTRAAGLLQDAIQHDPQRTELYLEKAVVEEAMGFRASAVATLLKARNIRPGDARVEEALSRYGASARPSTQPAGPGPQPLMGQQPGPIPKPTTAPTSRPEPGA